MTIPSLSDLGTVLGSRRSIGTWVKLGLPESVELLGLAGFDFVVLDLEHSPMSLQTASTLIAVARGRGLPVLVRVPDHAAATIQRCLDAGASGIVVPHVNDPDEARAAGRAARFPPRGHRGMGPTSRAGDWGMAPSGRYVDTQERVTVVAQIESAAGVRNAAEIAADPNIDALLFGPADLAQELGVDPDDPGVRDAMLDVCHAARIARVPVGTAIGGDPGRAAAMVQAHFSFAVVSNDATLLGSSARSLVADFRAQLEPGD